jgi:PIN domain nuclease of toxin-antitoxin system
VTLLLDTHVLLWAIVWPDRLSEQAQRLIEAPGTELLFSPANLWEIVIKNSLGRPDFSVDVRVLRRAALDNGYVELAVQSSHVLALEDLPSIHKDPFDRILLAQARAEGIALLTLDEQVAKYPGLVHLV